jgi:hypothetical protein
MNQKVWLTFCIANGEMYIALIIEHLIWNYSNWSCQRAVTLIEAP